MIFDQDSRLDIEVAVRNWLTMQGLRASEPVREFLNLRPNLKSYLSPFTSRLGRFRSQFAGTGTGRTGRHCKRVEQATAFGMTNFQVSVTKERTSLCTLSVLQFAPV